jgi:hypothetical protein
MAGGFGMQLHSFGRRGSRLTSASPLIGRGATEGEIDDFQLPGSALAGGDFTGLTGDEEFELFGPAAQVDTQTAAQSQWQRATLVGESANFLAFVRTAIEDLDDSRRKVEEDDEEDVRSGVIDFDELLPPATNSNVVAAQGFLHALTLGTRNMLNVSQEEAFGAISLEVR